MSPLLPSTLPSFRMAKMHQKKRLEEMMLLNNKTVENLFGMFNTVQDWFDINNKDARKFILLHMYTTFIENNSCQYIPFSSSLQKEFESLSKQIIKNYECFDEEKASTVIRKLEKEATLSMQICINVSKPVYISESRWNESVVARTFRLLQDKVKQVSFFV